MYYTIIIIIYNILLTVNVQLEYTKLYTSLLCMKTTVYTYNIRIQRTSHCPASLILNSTVPWFFLCQPFQAVRATFGRCQVDRRGAVLGTFHGATLLLHNQPLHNWDVAEASCKVEGRGLGTIPRICIASTLPHQPLETFELSCGCSVVNRHCAVVCWCSRA